MVSPKKVSLKVLGVAVMAFTLFTATTAQAAEVEVSFVLTEGSVEIGPTLAFDLPPDTSGITGTWDDVTGDFDGVLVVPETEATIPFSAQIAPLPAPMTTGTITLRTTWSSEPVVGTIDPDTGDVDLETTVTVSILLIQAVLDPNPPGTVVPLGITCTLGPIALQLSSSPDGEIYSPLPVDPDNVEGTFAVAQDGFTVDPVDDCSGNPAFNATVQTSLNQQLGLDQGPSTNNFTLLAFETGEITPAQPLPPVPTTTTTVAAPVAPAAAVTTGSPTFTG